MKIYSAVCLCFLFLVLQASVAAADVSDDPCGGADSSHVCVTDQQAPSNFIDTGANACAKIGKACSGLEVSCHNVAGQVDGISSTPLWEKSNVACYESDMKSSCVYRAACDTTPVGGEGDSCAVTLNCSEGFVCKDGVCVAETSDSGQVADVQAEEQQNEEQQGDEQAQSPPDEGIAVDDSYVEQDDDNTTKSVPTREYLDDGAGACSLAAQSAPKALGIVVIMVSLATMVVCRRNF